MSERQPIYEPYGPEWVAEMMKHRKADIVGLFQAFATARRPPVDSDGVDIMERVKAECTKHQKGVGAAGCNSCPLAGEGFNCVLDGPASHWNMPAMEAALSDSTEKGD